MNISEAYHKILEEIDRTVDSADASRADELLDALAKSERVFVTGAGRSGLMIRAFAQRLMQVGIDTYVVGETTTPEIRKSDLLVVGSGSGQTGGPLGYAQIARHIGAKVALVTAAKDSPLAQVADLVILLPAPTPKAQDVAKLPKSVQPMGTLFEQSVLVFLDALIILLMERMGVGEGEMFKKHTRLE
jgi:6-phospho-3-hexuloisomerase